MDLERAIKSDGKLNLVGLKGLLHPIDFVNLVGLKRTELLSPMGF